MLRPKKSLQILFLKRCLPELCKEWEGEGKMGTEASLEMVLECFCKRWWRWVWEVLIDLVKVFRTEEVKALQEYFRKYLKIVQDGSGRGKRWKRWLSLSTSLQGMLSRGLAKAIRLGTRQSLEYASKQSNFSENIDSKYMPSWFKTFKAKSYSTEED